jgi:hypothetical protein
MPFFEAPTANRTPSLKERTSDLFGVEFQVPILAHDELYAGKLVAALDRQHPVTCSMCGNSSSLGA